MVNPARGRRMDLPSPRGINLLETVVIRSSASSASSGARVLMHRVGSWCFRIRQSAAPLGLGGARRNKLLKIMAKVSPADLLSAIEREFGAWHSSRMHSRRQWAGDTVDPLRLQLPGLEYYLRDANPGCSSISTGYRFLLCPLLFLTNVRKWFSLSRSLFLLGYGSASGVSLLSADERSREPNERRIA